MRMQLFWITGFVFLLSLSAPALARPVAPEPLPYQDNFSANALDTSYWTVLAEDPGLTVQQIEGEIRVSGTVQDTHWGKNGLRTPGFPAQDFVASVDFRLQVNGEINQSVNLRAYFGLGRYFGIGYDDLQNQVRAYYTDSSGYHILPRAMPYYCTEWTCRDTLKIRYSHATGTFEAYLGMYQDYSLGSYTPDQVPGPLVVQFHQESQVSGPQVVDARFDNFRLDRLYEEWECIRGGCLVQLQDIDMLSATAGWAVGGSGAIWHWDGQRWNKQSSPSTAYLDAVDLLSPEEGWAGGAFGTLLHWDGAAWDLWEAPTWETITGLDSLARDDAWAVTDTGEILHWDGLAWSKVRANQAYSDGLYAIHMLAPDDGWAVGSIMLHWDGLTWNLVPYPVEENLSFTLFSLEMLSATDGWAVGVNNMILHWDGIAWQSVFSPARDALFDVEMLSPTDGWISGSFGQVLHWDGEAWNMVLDFQDGGPFIPALAFVTPDDGWLVDNNWFRHWNGETWSEWPGPPSEQLNGVALPAPGAGWAVGNEGVIKRRQGQNWTRMDAPTSANLNAVVAPGAYAPGIFTDQAWAVGDRGALLHWDGSQWISGTLPTSADLLDLSFVAPDAIWVVSSAGEILAWDGQGWNLQNSPSGYPLSAIDMLSRQDGWVADGYGDFWHWDGQSWSTVPNPGWRILDLDMLAPDDGWAVGGDSFKGTSWSDILHWDGNAWSIYPQDFSAILNSVSMESSALGWAVGDNGTILRWNGVFWAPARKSTWAWLGDVAVLPGQEGVAVGAGKLEILQLEYPRQRVYLPMIID